MGNQRLTQTQANEKKPLKPARMSRKPQEDGLEQLHGLGSNRAVNGAIAQHDLQKRSLQNSQSTNFSFRGLTSEINGVSATQRLVIQPKLVIGQPNDKYEQEADRVAQQVVQQLNAPKAVQIDSAQTIQRKVVPDEEEDELQMKPMPQRQSGAGEVAATPELESSIQQMRGGGQQLPDSIREPMERSFGANFSGVRVHANAQSDQLNRSISAYAFTIRQNIFFKQGAYHPESTSGKELLAHELTHVLQQTGGQQVQRKTEAEHNQSCPCSACTANLTVQRRSTGSCAARCSCPACTPGNANIQSKINLSSPLSIQRHAGHDEQDKKIQRKPLTTSSDSTVISHPIQSYQPITTQVQTRSPIAPTIHPTSNLPNTIQRHASWEHKMLGDVTPDALEIMGASRDSAVGREGTRISGSAGLRVTSGVHQGEAITQKMVLHTIDQEIRRLEYFRDQPPQSASKEAQNALTIRDRKDRILQVYAETQNYQAAAEEGYDDRNWQVRLVEVPLENGSEVVTYGELNTLADFYGSLDEMKKADADNFHRIIQGIRQESLFKFMALYDEISGTTKYQDEAAAARSKLKTAAKVTGVVLTAPLSLPALGGIYLVKQKLLGGIDNRFEGLGFAGAIGNTGTGNDYGELRLMSKIPGQEGKQTLPEGEETSYSAGLARNACHFAPESWHAWVRYHQQAIKDAKEAYRLQDSADQIKQNAQPDPGLITILKQDSAAYANDALLNNGFGDHYLQDSYAAGHLINKTQIMQWYVQWLDDHPGVIDYHQDKNWRKVQQIAYNQPGLVDPGQYQSIGQRTIQGQQVSTARNPQAVEDIQGDDWRVRFEALGLSIPASIKPGSESFKFVVWWQNRAMRTNSREITLDEALQEQPYGLKLQQIYDAIKQLVKDGVARVKGAGSTRVDLNQPSMDELKGMSFILREAYVPKNPQKFNQLIDTYSYSAVRSEEEKQAIEGYEKMAASATYDDYFTFMKSSFLQASTNVLHDHFCKEGLDVYEGTGQQVFKIYGDNAMLQRESSKGVRHSAITANMSRDTIFELITKGGKEKHSTQEILNRLPKSVAWKGTKISLADWHNQGTLKTFCYETIFPTIPFKKSKVPGILGGDMAPMIHRDQRVHGNDAF